MTSEYASQTYLPVSTVRSKPWVNGPATGGLPPNGIGEVNILAAQVAIGPVHLSTSERLLN